MNSNKSKVFSTIGSTVWISIAEFVRNTFRLYEKLSFFSKSILLTKCKPKKNF